MALKGTAVWVVFNNEADRSEEREGVDGFVTTVCLYWTQEVVAALFVLASLLLFICSVGNVDFCPPVEDRFQWRSIADSLNLVLVSSSYIVRRMENCQNAI